MSAFGNYLENKLLDHSLGTASYTMPTTVWVGLFTSNPAEDGSGTEVSGSGYARQAITFSAASSGTTSNSSAETFTASGGSFGTITHFALFDSVSGGNMLYYGALTASRTVNDGETFTIFVGALQITLN